jgi:uncharacterized delta-60 repeat protein
MNILSALRDSRVLLTGTALAIAGQALAQENFGLLDKAHGSSNTGHFRVVGGSALPTPLAVFQGANNEITRVLVFPGSAGFSNCPTAGRVCVAIGQHLSNGTGNTVGFPQSPVLFTQVRGADIDSAGNVYVVGSAFNALGDEDMVVVKYGRTGAIDATFGTLGVATISFNNQQDLGLAVKLDDLGRPVVAGMVTLSATDTDFGVARLTSNGQLDNSFSADGKVRVAFDLAPTQNDLRDVPFAVSTSRVQGIRAITVSGIAAAAPAPNGSSVRQIGAVTRLTETGSFDTTFCPTAAACASYNFAGLFSGRRAIDYLSLNPDNHVLTHSAVNPISGQTHLAGYSSAGTALGAITVTLLPNGDVFNNPNNPANVGLAQTLCGLAQQRCFPTGVHVLDPSDPRSDFVVTGAAETASRATFLQQYSFNGTARLGFGNAQGLVMSFTNDIASATLVPTSLIPGNSGIDRQGRILTIAAIGLNGGAADTLTVSRVISVLFANGFE